MNLLRSSSHSSGLALILWPSSSSSSCLLPSPFLSPWLSAIRLVYVHACVCAWCGLWSVSAGHQPVRAEWAGGAGDGAEAHRQPSRRGGEKPAKPHGDRWVTRTPNASSTGDRLNVLGEKQTDKSKTQQIYNLFILVLLASHLWEPIVCVMWCLNFLYAPEKVKKYFKNKDIFISQSHFAHLYVLYGGLNLPKLENIWRNI